MLAVEAWKHLGWRVRGDKTWLTRVTAWRRSLGTLLSIGCLSCASPLASAQATWAEAAQVGEQRHARQEALFKQWEESAVTAYQQFVACLDTPNGKCAPKACKSIAKKLEWLGLLCEAKVAQSRGRDNVYSEALGRAYRAFLRQPGISDEWLDDNHLSPEDIAALPQAFREKRVDQRLDAVLADFAQYQAFLPLSTKLDEILEKEASERESRAQSGDAQAQFDLAQHLMLGGGTRETWPDAAQWYRKAAEQGHAAAQYELALLYSDGKGVQEDDAQAMAWYRKAAEQGHAKAQNELGNLYESGRGVTKDETQAVAWYRKAAEQGLAMAQYNLGLMYRNGRGVPRDETQAVSWYRKGAEQGDADAQNNLGFMYDHGRGVPKDQAQAVAWYGKAAEQGFARAQHNVGMVYQYGRGVPKDEAQAVAWYRKAAEQGYADAQNDLGLMYESGRGVPKDETQAVAWYRKAAEQGLAVAQTNLGVMHDNGRGVPKDETQAMAWYRKAAEQGDARAQNSLGFMYANGRGGLARNHGWAVYWCALSAQKGNDTAVNNLEIYRQNLSHYRVKNATVNIRAKPSADAAILVQAKQGDIVYQTEDMTNGWYEVYLRDGHTIGFVLSSLLTPQDQSPRAPTATTANSDGPWPARPAKRPGVTSCNTRCVNGDCYRTYDDGRHVRFQAQQKWNPFNSQFEWDSGGC